jgi:HK97 family phage portal protein
MGFLSRIFQPSTVRSVEGQYRPGPYYLPISGGWLPDGAPWNYWQCGGDVQSGGGTSSMVEACISAYAQTVAMCPGDHWMTLPNGGRERVTTSALCRILRRPNDYQSISDFLLNAVTSLYRTGNTYALALRNNRQEVEQLHLMRHGEPRLAEGGAIFYDLSGNEVIERAIDGRLLVPQRDVLHIRLKTENNSLIGVSPLQAAALEMAAGSAALRQQVTYYLNQARPSFVLTTDQIFSKEQVEQLRDAWNLQAKGLNSGGTPILTAGLKPNPIANNSRDSQLAELLKMNDEAIANCFRVPLQVLGIGGTPFASTESLMKNWKNGGLGFALNHIEEAIGNFFGLKGQPDEYLELDTTALLRSSQKEYVETLVAGVRGGVFKIDEARDDLSLPKVKGGNDIRIQQQDVPLDWHEQQLPKQAAPPAALPAPPKDANDGAAARSVTATLFRAADEYDRRVA